ncbi:MAG TPA: aminotransferase class I/II-fold pyridoxal phosphate-dependent enzyme [Longimicrobiales bacterium]
MTSESKGRARGGLSTRAVHAGEAEPRPGEAVVTPVAQTSTFYSEPVPQGEVLYTRYGTNPNHLVVQRKLAALEGAEAALVLASGMAAESMAILAFAGAAPSRNHIVAQAELYGGTLTLFKHDLPALGIETTFVDSDEGWEDAIRPETALLYTELPVNPTMRIPDFPRIAQLAAKRALPLLVDATFATPINFRALEHGARLAIHSATKYLGGHSDLTAGAVVGSEADVERVRHKMKSFGGVLDPHATWLLERGMKTLAIRVERQNANALALAQWLEQHPAVEKVHYPGLPSHRDHERAKLLLDGFGGMLSVVVRGGDEAALRVCQRLRLLRVAPSLGGVDTLVSMPRFTSHAALTREQRQALGIDDGFVRLSIGIEDVEDLRADLEQALEPEGAVAAGALEQEQGAAGRGEGG